LHLGKELRRRFFDRIELRLEGADGASVQVVPQEEHLVLEELEHREHCRFGAAHRGDDVAVTITRLREQPFAATPKTGIGVLVELPFPFGEQVAGHSLHRVDALGHRTRTPLARLVGSVETVVHLLQIAALESDDAPVLVERRTKLLRRGILSVAGVLDAVDEDVTLLDADGLERTVIGRRAAHPADREERGDEDAPKRPLTYSRHARTPGTAFARQQSTCQRRLGSDAPPLAPRSQLRKRAAMRSGATAMPK